LGGRYRIVSLLGKGGMGEVYRADDLTLEQPVALKFLPEAWSQNADAIARFRNEVRVARQVSHPNVCRVHDLGEVEGLWFLSMEYVDGEDLGSLLRRIGRLPADKALEIARKLCAGLAAAHDKGILHGDLKPANIMLDRRGQVLLTDFGLAALAGEVARADITSGTPAYRAPEQLAGEEVTVRSDIYSLGLVKDVDPAVERVILRCLQAKPGLRPASAIAVAALAAGETPSPEMVVAAGERAGMRPRVAVPVFALVLAGIAVSCAMTVARSGLDLAAPRYSPEVLRARARDLLPKLGYPGDPADEWSAFNWYGEFFDWVDGHDKPRPEWRKVFAQEPALMRFTYRTSPGPMTAGEFHSDLLRPGIVSGDDPPVTAAGMTYLELDQHGHLMYFEARPPQLLEAGKAPAGEMDWGPLFAAAGIDAAKLAPAEPVWTWLSSNDTRAAWTGTWPGSGREMRVEAAALRSKPVGFYVAGEWSRPWRTASTAGAAAFKDPVLLIELVLLAAILVGAPLLARKNLQRGRGDRRSAIRPAGFIFVVHLVLWLCRSHVIASLGTLGMLLLALCTSTFAAVMVWVAYLALEPYVRRHWPAALISSTSALSGRIADPVVGRDVLIGLAAAVAMRALGAGVNGWLSSGQPDLTALDALGGWRATAGVLIGVVPYAARNSLFFLFLLFLLRALLRNQWAAGAAFAAIFTALTTHPGSHPALVVGAEIAIGFTIQAIMALVLLRWGLLAGAAAYWLDNVLDIPLTAHMGAWYQGYAVGMVAVMVGVAVWAARGAMRGQRVWPRDLFG
jgi:serine/threonine-protein kinase